MGYAPSKTPSPITLRELPDSHYFRFGCAIIPRTYVGRDSAQREILGEWFPPQEETNRRFDEIALKATEFLVSVHAKEPENAKERFRVTSNNLDHFILIGGEACQSGAVDLFHSVIVQAWTAFEVMAADLWKCALNAHPESLSNLNGALWEKDSESEQSPDATGSGDTERDSRKTIELRFLLTNKFNLSEKMGTVLKEKFGFGSIWAIREAYARAFSKKFNEIKAALMDDCFVHLAAVRNVIVHKAAKADEIFLKEIATCTLFAGLNDNDRLQINGQTVSDLVRPVFQRSIDLICAVDKWIDSSPKRKCKDAIEPTVEPET